MAGHVITHSAETSSANLIPKAVEAASSGQLSVHSWVRGLP